MLDDFNQEKQDQNLDPLSDEPSFLWGKKIGLLCLAVCLIGLFIFFTSDSWNSDSKSDNKEELLDELEQLKTRVSALESQLQTKNLSTQPSPQLSDDSSTPTSVPMENLQSLIEQELQESIAAQETPKVQEKPAPKKTLDASVKAQQTYTVRKGDTLSRISQQFYGTPKKWRKIVDANKERLGHNQMLKAGMTLVIPPKDL